jgi:hypothetical protein
MIGTYTSLRMVAERNVFQFAAVGTTIHSTIVRRESTINHPLNVFHNNGKGMEDIFSFLIMLFKNLL